MKGRFCETMSKTTLRIITFIVFLVGCFGVLVGTNIYKKSFIVHPDAVMTIKNPTSGMFTQSYLIGKMEVYINRTFRMKPSDLSDLVMEGAVKSDPNFFIPQSMSLSMLDSNPKNSENPFIMQLSIRNLDDVPIYVSSKQIQLRDVEGNIFTAHDEWQELLGKAGYFSGSPSNDMIQPKELKTMWLVYPTPSAEIEDSPEAYREYVRILYDGDGGVFTTKIEFPFNYEDDTPIGDYSSVSRYTAFVSLGALFLWLAICGLVYYRLSRKMDEYEEDEEEYEEA